MRIIFLRKLKKQDKVLERKQTKYSSPEREKCGKFSCERSKGGEENIMERYNVEREEYGPIKS